MPSGYSQNIHIDTEITLGALAANTAIIANILAASNANGFRIKKLKLGFDVRGKTIDEGPLSIGFQRDLTTTQVAEVLQAVPTGLTAEEARERANRPVYPWKIVPHSSLDDVETEIIEDVRDFPRDVPDGQHWSIYVMNHHNSTLTTGTVIHFVGVMVGTWTRD